MQLFKDSTISGLSKRLTIQSFLEALYNKINRLPKSQTIPYKGIKNTPFVLKLVTSFLPELYNINEISPENWGYCLHEPLYRKSHFDTYNSKIVDFSSYFCSMDVLSMPIVFNGILNQTGIYKLSCICDKNISLTIGLTNKDTFNEKIYNRTYKRCFWPQDIFGWIDSDLVSLSNNPDSPLEGKLRIHAGETIISESIKLNNITEVNLSIIWDSYQHIVYFYENNKCVETLCFEETDTEFVPFVYLYYDRRYVKSECLVRIDNTTLKF